MKKLIMLCLSALPLLLPSSVSADTLISSSISTDTTWSPEGGVYVINSNFTVEAGATLTILPGTIIKASTSSTNKPSIYGTLVAHGTEEAPIHFTSMWDDSVGGDTDGAGPTVGSDGHWQGLYFRAGSVGDLDYVHMSHAGAGGFGFGDYVGLENEGGSLSIDHSNIHDNAVLISNGAGGSVLSGTGIWNRSGDLVLTNSIVSGSSQGIYIESGTSTISHNIIRDNVGSGIYAQGVGRLTLTDNAFIANGSTGGVDASKEFIHSGNTSADLTGRGFSIAGYTRDGAILHSQDLPIIGAFTVEAGTTYTIAPGTIIKIGNGTGSGAINVYGTLRSLGTEAEPVYFTSIRDDSVGGDTNGDGSLTLPASKNWGSIFLEAGSKAEFHNTFIQYGGFNYNGEYLNIPATIYQRGAELTITDSSIRRNGLGAGIFQDAGTTTITHSEFADNNTGIWSRGTSNIKISDSSFHGHINVAIYHESGHVIDARGNWWGDASGPTDYNIAPPTPTGSGDPISSSYPNTILYTPWLTESPCFGSSCADPIQPVIIIPGIVGSKLLDSSDLIWPDLGQMFTDINDQFLTDNLSLDTLGNSLQDIEVGDVVKRELVLNIFDQNIFEALEQQLELDGYKLGESIFYFPYDWRLDLNRTRELLKLKIEEVKAQTGAEQVDIVAHSMGGLLTKTYISSYGGDSIDKLIFVGTPHLGAPKAGKIILEGDRLGIPFLEEDRIRDIAMNSPALHQLLPNFTYFYEFQGYLQKHSFLGNLPMGYTETTDFFIDEKSANPSMFGIAADLSDRHLEDMNFGDVEVFNIAGCKSSTQAVYKFGLGDNLISHIGYTSGDGTVPLVSADYIDIQSSNKFYIKDANHAELPSTSGVRELVLGILGGDTLSLASNVSGDSSFCGFKGKKLTWHSPVEIHVYDSLGRHTGPTSGNSIEYGIPGIDYDVIGHNKFVFLPTDSGEQYRVETVGLEEGTFDLSVTEVVDGDNISTEVWDDVRTSTSTTANLVVSDSSEGTPVESESLGITTIIPADAVLEGDLVLDLVSPETGIVLSGKEYKGGEYKKEVSVTLQAVDTDSGVLNTWYSIGGQSFVQYSGTFIIGTEGVYDIRYYSVDKAGNNEEVKHTQVIVGKLSKNLRKLE